MAMFTACNPQGKRGTPRDMDYQPDPPAAIAQLGYASVSDALEGLTTPSGACPDTMRIPLGKDIYHDAYTSLGREITTNIPSSNSY